MKTKLKIWLPAFALFSHWSAKAQGAIANAAEAVASAASDSGGTSTSGGFTIIIWAVVGGVVVGFVIGYAVGSAKAKNSSN